MKKETKTKLITKSQFRKKVVIKDQDLNIVVLIPISQEKFKEKMEISKVIEESASEKARVLELCLIQPLFEDPVKITHMTRKEIVIPMQTNPYNFIFSIKYISQTPIEITLLNVKRNVHHALVTMGNILKDLKNKIPLIEFNTPGEVKVCDVVKLIEIEIVPSIEILKFVAVPRLTFRHSYNIKHRDIDKLVEAKTSNIIGFALGGETGLEELVVEDIVKYFLKATLSRINIDKPYLILAEKPQDKKYEYIEFLKRLLRELYRVYVGGLPTPFDLRTDFEEVKLHVRAGKHIYVVDVDEVFKSLDKENIDKISRYIIDRLRELYSQGLGFLVFYGSSENLEKIRSLSLNKSPLWRRNIPYSNYIGKALHPIDISIREDPVLYNLANLIWGKIIDFERIEEDIDFDSYIVTLEEEFYRRIMEIASDPNMIMKVEPSKKDEEKLNGESLLHYGIKSFVVKYLIEHEKIPEHNIYTEYESSDIIIDVYTKHPKHGELAIEVETLYGTGLPLVKLKKTIESRISKGLKLWIVIPNVQFVLFLNDLIKLRNIYRKKYLDSIEFFTLDVYEEKLISLPIIINKVKELLIKRREVNSSKN